MPEATQPVADLIIVEIADVQGLPGPPGPIGPTGLGIDAPLPIITFSGPTLSVGTPHHNALVQLDAASPVVIIPRDESLNLPVGFTTTVMYVGDLQTPLTVQSETPVAPYGSPARRAAYYSGVAQNGVAETFAPPFMPITLLKLGPNRWLVSGHYVP